MNILEWPDLKKMVAANIPKNINDLEAIAIRNTIKFLRGTVRSWCLLSKFAADHKSNISLYEVLKTLLRKRLNNFETPVVIENGILRGIYSTYFYFSLLKNSTKICSPRRDVQLIPLKPFYLSLSLDMLPNNSTILSFHIFALLT